MRRPMQSDADVEVLYAAHALMLVRLAVLLGADLGSAEALVQRAFVRLLRRPRRHRDLGDAVATLRASVVAATRAVARPASDALPTSVSRVLPRRHREVAVLSLWAGCSTRAVAVTVGVPDEFVDTALRDVVTTLGRQDEPADRTRERIADALQGAADRVGPADLRGRFADVLAKARGSRRTVHSFPSTQRKSAVAPGSSCVAPHRRRRALRQAAVVALAGLALSAATVTLAGRSAQTPAPEPTPAPTETTTALSAALATGDRPRSEIPWSGVGRGWVAVAAAAAPTALTTTLLLVAPDGTRYAIGTSPDGMVVQDVSPDGRTALLAIGSEAYEWDLVAGTSRRLGTAYGWKTMRYAGIRAQGYLVLWTDSSSQVRLEHRGLDGRLRADYPMALAPVAGSPGTPALVVDANGRDAYVASRGGGILAIDLSSDAVGTVPVPGSGCAPRSRDTANEVVLVCSSGAVVLTVASDGSGARPVRPLLPSGVVGAWQAGQRLVLQLGATCSPEVTTVDQAGRVEPLTLTGPAAGLVPNGTAGETLYLGGTRCADDGGRLVAYDLLRGTATELVGQTAGRLTVRQAVLVEPLG